MGKNSEPRAEMTKRVKNVKLEIILLNVAIILIGVLMVVFPEQSQTIICRVVGILLCAWGLFLMTAAQQRNIPASTCFLTKREQLLAGQLLPELTLTFFGGAEACERAVCCWLPDYLDESWLSSGDGPVAAVRAEFYAQDTLTHRDFLGSLMGVPLEAEKMTVTELDNPYYGTYSRKLYGLSPIREQLLAGSFADEIPYERWDNGERTDAPMQFTH